MINTNQLKITSLNCERTTNINGLKQLIENNDITLLQDLGKTTRSLLDIIQLPLTIIYSKLTAIVIHHKIDDLIKVTNQHTFELDPVAFPRVSDAVIRVNNKRKYHIINVYYPPNKFDEQRQLIRMIYRQLKNKNTPIIMGGDFNHILNPEIDRQFQVRHNYSETRTTEESLLRNTQLKLIDAYRCFEPQAINFTNHNQLNNRRIDRFHLSERLEKQLLSFHQKKDDAIRSTHEQITIVLKFTNKPVIDMGKKRFMIKDYHIENPTFISNILNSNPRDWAHLRQIIKRLTKKKRFPKVPRSTTLTADTFDDLRIRYNGKSKPKKHIFQTIRDVHGRKASNTKEILDIAHGYLSNLFNKSPHNRQQITSYLEDFTPNISPEQIATLDQPITLDELTKELKAKSNLSAPGEDGYGFRFIKSIWETCGPLLVNMGNHIRSTGNLPPDFKLILITLIPKTTKSDYISDTRPISVINVGLRLISAVMNNKLQQIMESHWDHDQHAFIKNRSIQDIVEKFAITWERVKRWTTYPFAMVLLDFSKAFDSLNHSYINAVLMKYKFPQSFINFCMAITSGHIGNIRINDKSSEPLRLLAGVRQGNPLSPTIFILCLEPFLAKLKHSIVGIPLEANIFVKVLAYADDVTVCLNNPKEQHILSNALNQFAKASGLEVNKNKTILLSRKIGLYKLPFQKHHADKPEIKYMGVPLSPKLKLTFLKNWTKNLHTAVNLDLPLQQRALGINTYLISKLHYQDTLASFKQSEINKIALQMNQCFRGVGEENLLALPNQGGFGLMDIRTQTTYNRCKIIYKMLTSTEPHNWHLQVYRAKLQHRINYIQKRNKGSQILPWYNALVYDCGSLTERLIKSRTLLPHLTASLIAWFQINKQHLLPYTNESQLMEFFPQETRLTLYTTTKINPHFVPTLNGTVDMTYYNHGSKKHQLALRKTLMPSTWSATFNILEEQWALFFKQINKVKQQHPHLIDHYHRFNLGHYTYYKLSQPNCDLCEQPYTTTPLEHRFCQCIWAKKTWQRLGPRNLSNHFSSYIANPLLTTEQYLALSCFIAAITALEIHWRYAHHRNTLDESSFVRWVRGFKYHYYHTHRF